MEGERPVRQEGIVVDEPAVQSGSGCLWGLSQQDMGV